MTRSGQLQSAKLPTHCYCLKKSLRQSEILYELIKQVVEFALCFRRSIRSYCGAGLLCFLLLFRDEDKMVLFCVSLGIGSRITLDDQLAAIRERVFSDL